MQDPGSLALEDRFFLQIAVKNGLVAQEDGRRVAQEAARRGTSARVLLLERGLLDERQVERVREAMAASQVMRLDALYADVLLARSWVTPAALDEARARQRSARYRVRLGSLLLSSGQLDPERHRSVVSEVISRIKTYGDEAFASGSARFPASSSSPFASPPASRSEPPPFATSSAPLGLSSAPDREGPPTSFAASRAPLGLSSADAPRPPREPEPPTIPLHDTQELPAATLPRELRQASAAAAARGSPFGRSRSLEQVLEDLEESAEPSDRLLASAVSIGLSSEEALLESDIHQAGWLDADRPGPAGGSSASFVLDRIELEEAAFRPADYVARKRLRSRLALAAAGVLLLAATAVGAALGAATLRNRGRLDALRRAITDAEGAAAPARQRELFLAASERLEGLGGVGVEPALRLELAERVRWGLLRAEAGALLAAGEATEAQALLERRAAEVPARAREEHAGLLVEARRRGHVLAAERAEAAGALAEAVADYRRALELGDPGSATRGRLDAIRSTCVANLDRAFAQARASLDPADEARFVAAAKQLTELFREDPGTQAKLEQLAFLRALREGRARLERGDLARAAAAFEEARRLRPNAPEVLAALERVERRRGAVGAEERGRALEERGALAEALSAYRAALAEAPPAARERIERAVARCEARLAEEQEREERGRRRAAALEALRASRADEACATLEALERERPDRRTAALLALARRVRGMVYIPAGSFLMGSRPDEPDARPREQPQREVTLPGYFIDRLEVTNAAYAAFVATGEAQPPPHWDRPERGEDGAQRRTYAPRIADHPVTHVSWAEASAFAAWRGGRLPTEAEWEKAARGADGRRFPWGERTSVRAHIHVAPNRLRAVPTAPAGVHGDDRSPFGVLDLAGNVAEWTADPFRPYPGAPSGVSFPDGRRAIRGGSYRWPIADARCAARDGAPERDYRNATIGFRVVVEVPPEVDALR